MVESLAELIHFLGLLGLLLFVSVLLIPMAGQCVILICEKWWRWRLQRQWRRKLLGWRGRHG